MRHLADLSRDELFEQVVEEVLASLPPPFDRVLGEVAVVIEDEPSAALLEETGVPPGARLFGLYSGVPRTAWGADRAAIPRKVTLFRMPLEATYPDRDRLAERIRITVLHELAHHMGIDDERLDELGLGSRGRPSREP